MAVTWRSLGAHEECRSKTAVTRIWNAIQPLTPAPGAPRGPVAPKQAKATKEATTKDEAPTAREGSKRAIVLDLLRRDNGATNEEIQKATDWQAHSIRGFISGNLGKKMGLKVETITRENGAKADHIK